ncbi:MULTISPECIES: chromate efflux transporter [Sphingomonadaceae]|jgi:chromate transporter|uniref:Chromate transporter n=5 Tax=Sphingomonadaceae TaxID=41297 RepID=A0A1I5UR79_9SPHN|nr:MULTISPECIES: chromate efflux transporter [Sphingomonadaceae]MBY0306796.1 chromate efflux transporter [Sphingomonas sp.]ETI59595.1 chromate transporter [Sphingobium sp. C100]MBB4050206.1 chromate transporter [Sphingomonas zeae]NUU45531.1 chromate efflux transporter [Sphingomonas zeae]THG37001.1 chromate efflux transporter [Sphingomonas olei]
MSSIEHPAPASAALDEAQPPELSYPALFLRFLRFGMMAFGGPVAQIAMIRRELVDEERWIPSDRFNKLLAVMQVLPGPEAHELCVHLGIRAKGRLGGLLAGLGFMLPGLVLMLALAWAYTRLPIQGTLLGAAFLGIQAAVIAVIVRAVHRIGEHILFDPWLWAAAIAAAAASLAGVSFWIVLPAAGAAYALGSTGRYALAAVVVALAVGLAALTWAGSPGGAEIMTGTKEPAPAIAALFWAGLKGGLLTFGGAYTAIPFIRNDTVGRGWMTDAQFLDGLGLSGILPAPLVIFATFVGWISGGLAGALAMTAGMFLPAFAFSLLLYDRLEAVVEHKRLQLFLAGVAAGVVGLIVVTVVDLARTTGARTPNLIVSALIFAVSLAIMYRWKSKLATPVVLAIGAAIGAIALS